LKEPNFFIAGAPKCGTTALYEYLRQHPQMYMSPYKEPHLFAEDLRGIHDVRNEQDYWDLFRGADDRHLAVGEGSIMYIYSDTAMQVLRQRFPDARIIIMLRNPLKMLPSLHSQWMHNVYEVEEDVEKAWNLQAERAAGRNIPSTCPVPKLLQYGKMIRLGEQVQRALDAFPREQVMIELAENLGRDTKGVYEKTLAFLQVPSDGRTEFPRVNERRYIRSRWYLRLVNRRSYPLALRVIGRRFGVDKLHTWLFDRNMSANSNEGISPPPLREEFLDRLRAELADDVALLSDLVEQDLSCWLQPGQEPVSQSR